MPNRLKETPVRCNYSVMLLKHKSDCYATLSEKLLVAKFFAKGDAIEYAIHRAKALPMDKQFYWVFEVETANGAWLYRAG